MKTTYLSHNHYAISDRTAEQQRAYDEARALLLMKYLPR